MKKNKIRLITIVAGIAISFAALSCKTNDIVVSEDLTFSQLIQKGQDAAATENYRAANAYFVACIDRYGSDLKCYVEARYELGTINLKQKKYDLAKTMFNELIAVYDRPEALYQVQPKFKKLATIQLQKIADIEAKQQEKEAKKKK